MYKFIIKNCPAIQNLLEWTGEFDDKEKPVMTLDTADYCIKNKCECAKIDNCLIKETVKTCNNASHKDLHFTPSEILKLYQIKQEPIEKSECEGLDCAWCTEDCR